MASVWLATQLSFNRPVAIKIMNPALATDPTFSQRFLREARLMAQLSHPHIIPVFDIGQHDHLHYMAMEHIAGGTLKQRMRQHSLDDDAIDAVLRDVASALDYTGEQDIIHRDVKPDNIMFRANGSAVLMDFGIARPLLGDDAMTQMGTIVGTPKYMSPEQHRGRDVDARTDLYALGVVLFEMLTGQAPYNGDDAMSIGIRHIQDPIPLLPADKRHWQPILRKLLAKDPAQRFQRGSELLQALKQRPASAAAVSTPAASTVAKASTGNAPAVKLESRMRCKEVKEKTGLLSSRYLFDIYVMADDYPQYQGHFEKIASELRAWHQQRGKKAAAIRFKATIHPWIAGRVKESLKKLRQSDSHPWLSQVTIDVNLVGADGKPIEQYQLAPTPA